MTKIPHTVDRHVGQRIRARRMARRVTQEGLADGLGLTFQQVQKYEKGTNRVSASRMQEIAQILGVAPAFFFEGLPADGAAPGEQQLLEGAFLTTAEGAEIARAWPLLNHQARQSLVNIVRTLTATPALARAA